MFRGLKMYKYIIIPYKKVVFDTLPFEQPTTTDFCLIRFKSSWYDERSQIYLRGIDKAWFKKFNSKNPDFLKFDFDRKMYRWDLASNSIFWMSLDSFSLTAEFYKEHVMEFEDDESALLILELEEGDSYE